MSRSARRTSVATPPRRPFESCVATSCVVKPAFAARVGIDADLQLGIATCADRRGPPALDLSQLAFQTFRDLAERLDVVAEDLDLDGSAVPRRSPSMSCSSCTNSISTPGSSCAKRARCSEMISSTSLSRCAARLEVDEDVAAVLLGGEHAHLGAGSAREPGHFGRALQHRLEPPQHLGRFPAATCRSA
jgi:hypothetical protein